MKFSFDWSNATSPERRDLIFENRNKEYGGFVIRRDYERHVIFAMMFTFLGTVLLISTPHILSYFSDVEIKKPKKITDGIILETFPPMVIPVPVIPKAAPPPSLPKTTKFTTPILTANVPNDDMPLADLSKNDNIGTSTRSGEQNIDLPAEPVTIPKADSVFISVEEMPGFPGGEEKLIKYLSGINYPSFARENGISGKVYISFIIDKEGKIKNAKLLHGIGGGCDEEALRVVFSMPDWKPGRQNGQAVSVQYNLPINFNLKKR